MDCVRKENVFEGRDNDWLGFVLQQVEFYKNVEQYITNIEADITDVDDAITKVMNEIEETDFNVIQGENILRRLKNLIGDRKNLSKQLKCLRILTANLDVKMITEEYESRLEAIMKL